MHEEALPMWRGGLFWILWIWKICRCHNWMTLAEIGNRAAADPQYTNRCPHPTHGVNTKLGWVLLVIRRRRHRSPGKRVKHSKWWRNGVSICTEMFEFDNLDIENVSCYLWIPKVTHFNQINNIKHGPFWSWCDGRTGTHVLPTLLFW